MEIRVLRYFLTVAREGNLTRAAESLHITQPTLSRQLMQLEDELGTILFERGKRKMILTEEGMILKRRAEEIVNLSEKAKQEIGTQDINGSITISCGLTAATQRLGKLIKDFKELYPQVQFHFLSGDSDFTIENIDHGLVDIGVLLEPVELEKMNYVRLKQKERWGILMKKDSPLATQDYVTPLDIKELPLINTSRQKTQDHIKEWYGKGFESLNFCASSELTTSASMLVQNDIGYAVVIEGACDYIIHQELCFKPFYPELYSYSLFAWKKYQTFSLTVSKFIDFIINNNK